MVEAVDQLVVIVPALVEMVAEPDLLVMAQILPLQILVVEAVVAQATQVLGVVDLAHLVL